MSANRQNGFHFFYAGEPVRFVLHRTQTTPGTCAISLEEATLSSRPQSIYLDRRRQLQDPPSLVASFSHPNRRVRSVSRGDDGTGRSSVFRMSGWGRNFHVAPGTGATGAPSHQTSSPLTARWWTTPVTKQGTWDVGGGWRKCCCFGCK